MPRKFRWSGRELNPGHLDPEARVLPLDHRPQINVLSTQLAANMVLLSDECFDSIAFDVVSKLLYNTLHKVDPSLCIKQEARCSVWLR